MAVRNLADWRLIFKRGRIPTPLGGLRGDIGTELWNDWLDGLTSPGSDIPGLIVGFGGGLKNIVEDLTPQLGADLDMNAFDIRALDAAGPEILDIASNTNTPTLIPNRGTNSGVGSSGSSVSLISNGSVVVTAGVGVGQDNFIHQRAGGLILGSASGSYGLHNVLATATIPTLLPSFLNETTGIGGAANIVSTIVSGAEVFQAAAGGLTFFQNMVATIARGPALLNETASDGNPTVVPDKSDLTTGLGIDDQDGWALYEGGVRALHSVNADVFVQQVLQVGGTDMRTSIAAGPSIQNEISSATNPTIIPDKTQLTTGLGGTVNNWSLIRSSVTHLTGGSGLVTAFVEMNGNNPNGPSIRFDEASTSTNPTFNPDKGEVGTGLGGNADNWTLIRIGVNQLEGTSGVITASVDMRFNGTNIGFFSTAPVPQPTGVTVDAAGIHAALVTLGLITA